MATAVITGIGWVTAAGMGCAKDYDDFAMTDGPLPEINPRAVFDKPYPRFRRLDAYSGLGLAAIAFALKDAGLDEWREKRNIGIIASTEHGCLKTDIDYFHTVTSRKEISSSPALFSYTLPNSFLGEASILFGLNGTTFIINERIPLGPACLQMALDSIEWAESDKMLCGVCNLGPPPPFEGTSKAPPGALFFVMEQSPGKGSSYGEVTLKENGAIHLAGMEVKGLDSLVRRCLAIR